MKFLEEDEDETMYLGDEFDAFIAALNREIEEENSSTSQPPTRTDDGVGTNHTTVSRHGLGSASQQPPNHTSRDMNHDPLEPNRPQDNQHNVHMSRAMHMQNTDKNPAQNTTQNLDNECQLQRMQRMSNQQDITTGQAANAMNQPAHLQVDFGLLLPDIQSQIDNDRAMQVQGLYNRLKTGNIQKSEFLQHMRALVGEHTIQMAGYRFQSSFSTYGNPGGNYHTGASPNMNLSSLSLQMRQGPIHPIRTHGGGPTYFTSSSPNSSHWQPSMHKDQCLMSSMAYGKQDHMDQMNEQQHKTLVSAPQRPSSFSPGQHEQMSGVLGSSKDITFEMLSSRPGFSTPMNKPKPKSIIAQLEYQNASAGNLSSGAGNNAKAIPKKPTVTQKKPFEAPPVSSLSKKQKVSGAFSDQSIWQLNDVTANSGVNLGEEEELLFSGFKKENRISETSRKVVQEEEERLFLQKIPLQKKVAEIMAKCGVNNKSNDVERCLSRCVEERMHGFITNLIRLSKQRVNIEKPRHRTVITSDVWQQIRSLNQKAREELEEKQADADKLQRADKVNNDEMRATAANVAARAALGGDDTLLKWKLMAAQSRQKREGGPDAASASQPSVDVGVGPKPCQLQIEIQLKIIQIQRGLMVLSLILVVQQRNH
ncbi:hypothetical protein L1987_44545 [Smallanthus sonchifolius]|uniref:Uncharacterized protein n=1 Tax=Smallanthus sonchifolius TaxID=185202 RepID=A0ACB9GRV9_9ASTR|nr:hypothetical protein L1987_44545 [Smallanthus sonchifolius]